MQQEQKYISSYCTIQNNVMVLNGEKVLDGKELSFPDFAKKVYQFHETDYPKFFKMDNLSKLAFLASDVILNNELHRDGEGNVALLFANRSSSLDTDIKFQDSINDRESYYPSPAVFVYTLPNICLGEISIRHKLFTENSFFIFEAFNPSFFANYAGTLLDTHKAKKVLCGWVEFFKDDYKAFMYMVSKEGNLVHTAENIQTLYNK